ncbi:MAG TPA: LysM peptidoglycan-binding domain-containing protein [Methylotenera sp.]|nr:LysM peptidoglycan-binding domain-containing protein [Methylotenera sp.]HPV44840.1 LysM peptidoglycan-binding domain-containing protein [Methylotenera sp.]
MNRHIITLLVLACLSLNANAEDIQLQKNHPDRYVVVKGDTLWGISGKFLKDPWQWPKVWKMNRAQIKNPHWIYPGDVIVLDKSGASPQLRLLRETVTLEPGVRIEPLEKEAIHTIAPSVIDPFLSQPLLIENGKLDDAPRIISGQDNRVILSPGTRVYISNIQEGEGVHWDIYRPGEALRDPDTNEVLGTEAIYLGDVNIARYGAPATGDIVKAKEEIFTKDRLVVAPDEFKSSFVPHAPEADIRGRIMRIYGGVAEGGPNTVVSINRGKNDGLEEGHVLAISRYGKVIRDPEYKDQASNKVVAEEKKLKQLNFDVTTDPDGKKIVNFEKEPPQTKVVLEPGQVKLPDERVGLLMIFRTFDRVSYGLIMSASDAIYTLDSVHTP